jgi:hypothetical protein
MRKCFSLGPMDNKNLPAQDVSDLKRWVDEAHRDPRARQRPSELDMKMVQANQRLQVLVHPHGPPAGA